MLKIAIIGCGQIGSRHLQALPLLSEGAQIHLLDSSADSIALAESRFYEFLADEKQSHFTLHKTSIFQDLPAHLDVAIIASGAAPRASLCRSLLDDRKVDHLILEKFLFQRADEYTEIGSLLESTGTNAVVNQWMSSLYAFRRMGMRLGAGPYHMTASGNGWGLCCNAAHLLEYFDYLNGRKDFCECAGNFEAVIDAKRPGYKELLGGLTIQSTNGSTLEMLCGNGAPSATIDMEIVSSDRAVKFLFGLSSLDCIWSDGLHETLWIPMQSRQTHLYVEDFMVGRDCGLPSFERSAYQHLALLGMFQAKMREVESSFGEICPIT